MKLEKEAKVARGGSDSLKQVETAEILDNMNLDSDDTYTLFFSQHPNGTNARKAYEAGISADDYLYFLAETDDMEAEKKENGETDRGSKKTKVEDLLYDMNLDEEEYWTLMEIAGYKRP